MKKINVLLIMLSIVFVGESHAMNSFLSAIRRGDVQAVSVLLTNENFRMANAKTQETVLHVAAAYPCLAVMELLLRGKEFKDNPTVINQRNYYNKPPMYILLERFSAEKNHEKKQIKHSYNSINSNFNNKLYQRKRLHKMETR